MAEATDAVPFDKLDGLLTCSICLEILCEPRTLPCFHSFCKSCLAKFVKRHRPTAMHKNVKEFNCPTCRLEFTLKPSEDVEGMPSSHFIRNMLEVMAIQRRANTSQCSRCKEPAINRCTICEIFLCDKCFTAHESWWGDKNHTVLSITELSQPENQAKVKAKLQCRKHDTKTLKFYCETCKELICRYCMDFNHLRPEHLCHPLPDVAEKQRKVLGSHCAILKERLKQGNKGLNLISNATQSLEDNVKNAKDKITQQKQKMLKRFTEKLEDKAELMIQEVDKNYKETFEQLAKQKTGVCSYVNKVKSSYNLATTLFEKGNDEEILSSQKMIEENIEKTKAERPSSMTPVHNGNIQYKGSKIKDVDILMLLDKMGEVACSSAAVHLKLCHTSIILNGNYEYNSQLIKWLGDQFQWRLCYQASKNGWSAADFHKQCDKKGPTMTLIKVGDYVFGGYSDQSWEGEGFKQSCSSFLFSLRNKDGVPPFKSPIEKNEFAISCDANQGPCFGSGCDLYICDNSHLNQQSYTYFGSAYKLPAGYIYRSVQSKSFLAGSYKFTPTEIEVFY